MEEITLTRMQVRELSQAIQAMDGRMEVAKDGDGKTLGIINKPYEFDNYKVVYALARTLTFLKEVNAAIDKEIVAIKHKSGYEEKEFDWPSFWSEKLDEKIKVHKVSIKALDLHKNKLPGTVVAGLMPMLTDDYEEKKGD